MERSHLLVAVIIVSSIHPFPGAIPVIETYPGMKRICVLDNEFLEKEMLRDVASFLCLQSWWHPHPYLSLP
jgi:hypothetical protein